MLFCTDFYPPEEAGEQIEDYFLSGTEEETDENGKTFDILYDIIIKQTGELHSDWTGVPLDVERYENVTFEPSDQKWIERF